MTNFLDDSNLDRIDPALEQIFDQYSLTYFPNWKLSEVPVQRCSDDKYISDNQVLDYYRNLHYELIRFRDYPNRVIEGMVDFSFWLVTSMSQKGIQSPLNMYHWTNIHPGKKRYIISNYIQFDDIPILVQHRPNDVQKDGGIPVTSVDQLIALYGHNVSIKLRKKSDELLVECSWHGETQKRDRNGYDNWYRAAAESVSEENILLPYLLEHGLRVKTDVKSYSINTGVFKTHASRDLEESGFFLSVPALDYLNYDLWKLYFHFDPRVGIKRCKTTGIEIHNEFGDPNWVVDNLDFKRTLNRPWLHDPEK